MSKDNQRRTQTNQKASCASTAMKACSLLKYTTSGQIESTFVPCHLFGRLIRVLAERGGTGTSELEAEEEKRLRRPGFEPGPRAWQARIIPLDYRRSVRELSPCGYFNDAECTVAHETVICRHKLAWVADCPLSG